MGSLIVEPKVLADALAAVKPALSRSSIDALRGVKITNSMDGPTLQAATNMDVHVTRKFAGILMDGELSVVVPHAELVKVCKAFDGRDSIRISNEIKVNEPFSGTEVVCSNGNRKITVRTNRIEDFPERPTFAGKQIIRANAGELRAAILKADKFRSHDETRPVLTGMHFDSSVVCVTDSYRLMVDKIPGWLAGVEHAVTVSGAGFALAAKTMPKDDTNVEVFTYDRWSIVQWPGTQWFARNIDGQFPNYKQLLPDKWEGGVQADTDKLLAGAKLGTQFLTKNAPLRLTLNGKCVMAGSTPDASSFEEEIVGAYVNSPYADRPDIDLKVRGTDFTIGLNPEFLAEALAALGSEQARLRVISPLRPLLIENTDHDDEKHLLMPIRLNV